MKILTITVNPALDLTAVVHSFQAGSVNRIHSHQEDAGGKGVNVSSFLANFGLEVVATGFLGRENRSAFDKLMSEKKIQNDFLEVEGRTRSNIKLVDESKGKDGITDLNFPGFQVSTEKWNELLKLLPRLTKGVSFAVVSGSLPEGLNADHYAQLVKALKALKVKVAVDTSGPALRAAMEALPDCIKPNETELSEALGKKILDERDALIAAKEWIDKGIESVIVSMGERGALFVRKDEAIFAQASKVEVKSTVGAGDAMLSGYLVARERNLSLEDSAKLASAFSLGTLSLYGPRLPEREIVEAFAPKVICKRVSIDSLKERT